MEHVNLFCKTFQVRFGALQVEEEIANKLGEEFMVLLPEAIPFLAELMEGKTEITPEWLLNLYTVADPGFSLKDK